MKCKNDWKSKGFPRKLILGNIYRVSVGDKYTPCTFIKVTEKGFNFLNLETYECVFRNHFYKGRSETNKNVYMVPRIIETSTWK